MAISIRSAYYESKKERGYVGMTLKKTNHIDTQQSYEIGGKKAYVIPVFHAQKDQTLGTVLLRLMTQKNFTIEE